MRYATLLLPVLAMTACHSPGPPPANGEAVVAAPGPQRAQIRARATFHEKLLMPAGSVLSVRLIDLDQAAGSDGAVLAEASFEGLPGPPYAFALPYDPALLREDGRYGLHASLATPQGETFFETPEPFPIVPRARNEPEFRMWRTP